MKRLIVFACVSFVVVSALDAAEMSLKRLKRTGGLITKPSSGLLVALDSQDRIKEDVVAAALSEFAKPLQVASRRIVAKDVFSTGKALEILAKHKATAGVFVIDDPTLPIALVAPEDHWGVINVARLTIDGPSTEKLQVRFAKEFVRVASVALGAWSSQMMISALQPTASLQELDKIGSTQLGPDSIIQVHNYMEKIGFTMEKTVPYKLACKQGWAPPPTNEYQKAIWDEIHAIPDKPLKITYDKAAQKPVVK